METINLVVTDLTQQHQQQAQQIINELGVQADTMKAMCQDLSSLNFRREALAPELMEVLLNTKIESMNYDRESKRLTGMACFYSPGGTLFFLFTYSTPAENEVAETFTVVIDGKEYQINR